LRRGGGRAREGEGGVCSNSAWTRSIAPWVMWLPTKLVVGPVSARSYPSSGYKEMEEGRKMGLEMWVVGGGGDGVGTLFLYFMLFQGKSYLPLAWFRPDIR
jgi:hypothetical protein